MALLTQCCPAEFGGGRTLDAILSAPQPDEEEEGSIEGTVTAGAKSPCALTASRLVTYYQFLAIRAGIMEDM